MIWQKPNYFSDYFPYVKGVDRNVGKLELMNLPENEPIFFEDHIRQEMEIMPIKLSFCKSEKRERNLLLFLS